MELVTLLYEKCSIPFQFRELSFKVFFVSLATKTLHLFSLVAR